MCDKHGAVRQMQVLLWFAGGWPEPEPPGLTTPGLSENCWHNETERERKERARERERQITRTHCQDVKSLANYSLTK